MGDLKTPFNQPVYPNTSDVGGAGVLSRGADPLIDLGGSSGLQPVWNEKFVPDPSGQETANSVSGLPLQPNRFEDAGSPPQPPTLQDRNPGTIDQR